MKCIANRGRKDSLAIPVCRLSAGLGNRVKTVASWVAKFPPQDATPWSSLSYRSMHTSLRARREIYPLGEKEVRTLPNHEQEFPAHHPLEGGSVITLFPRNRQMEVASHPFAVARARRFSAGSIAFAERICAMS
jgi:hypothetical protein